MATFLYKLGRLCFRRRWWVALLWLALLFGVGGAAASAGAPPDDDFALPGTEAQEAFDVMEQEFPQANAENMESRVVFQAPDQQSLAESPEYRAAIDDVRAQLEQGDLVESVTDPFEAGTVNETEDTAYLSVSYDGTWSDITPEMHEQLLDAMETGRDAGLTVEADGEVAMGEMEMGGGEVIGIVVAAIVLVITFGSLVAAGLPLLTALIGVGVAMTGITALSSTLGLSETTGILAMMIGLAVGIDYALFIASRYRAELVEGHSREEAAARAVGTAGSAVVFAGLTVIIALAGLAIVNVPLLTKMGAAAAGAVAVAVILALTLVPAALGIVGKRIFGRRLRKQNPETGVPVSLNKPGRENGGTRWARAVLRRPGLVLAAAVVGLGVLAIPVASMEQGLPDNGTQPEDTTLRKSYDLLSEGFGPGFNGPLMMVIDGTGGADAEQVAGQVSERLAGMDEIITTTPPSVSPEGTVATVMAFPTTGPSDHDTTVLVEHIRDDIAPEIEAETGANVLVSGATAANIDFSNVMSDALVPYLTLVVGLAFVLLVLVFRSLLVPLKAALGFLLSVLAALGAVVAVFQWGWAADLVGVEETGPIMSMMPIFMVGVIFGLAMDYEVFLVTRMREAYVHGEDARQAVVTGFNLNARVVTAAAAIMISVFAGFAITGEDAMIKMMGLGLAAAVLLDAFVVRMTIVPALLGLIGDRAWWLPRWLDRLLPNVDVEGESLERYLEANGKGRATLSKEREPAGVS
ncbi:MMPL family transporter [Streptomyces sp. 3MP-14]|uniref:MMPL family transporter n=1 Tax=Streptomyces mimosae TaxID=2586635 RepID=A0A5N6A9Y0_9ACTN|nr:MULTISPECIES: MMPL family transporter [Streptomyces]KAB8164318.1 MMPL family transporter [Streptomyces mimosae]KAB8176595.1 MMPL family transporter [Streptomyces sp. 3MP-14]